MMQNSSNFLISPFLIAAMSSPGYAPTVGYRFKLSSVFSRLLYNSNIEEMDLQHINTGASSHISGHNVPNSSSYAL